MPVYGPIQSAAAAKAAADGGRVEMKDIVEAVVGRGGELSGFCWSLRGATPRAARRSGLSVIYCLTLFPICLSVPRGRPKRSQSWMVCVVLKAHMVDAEKLRKRMGRNYVLYFVSPRTHWENPSESAAQSELAGQTATSKPLILTIDSIPLELPRMSPDQMCSRRNLSLPRFSSTPPNHAFVHRLPSNI